METHADRFKHMMQEWDLTQEELGNLCGLKRGTIGTIVNGRTVPDVEALARLKKAKPMLSWDWLLLGVGPMVLGEQEAPAPRAEGRRTIELSQNEHKRELVASAENVLLRELLSSKDEMIALLKAELGKPNDNSDAAGPTEPTTPPTPRVAAGFRMAWMARRREQKRAAGLS